MYGTQLKAYKDSQQVTMSGREIEASVLTKAAILLKNCQNNWDAPDLQERLDEALRFNQTIWTLFQAELASPDNPLPQKLREDIISLGIFIDRRIFEVMAMPEPEKLAVIININLNLAAGLRGSPG